MFYFPLLTLSFLCLHTTSCLNSKVSTLNPLNVTKHDDNCSLLFHCKSETFFTRFSSAQNVSISGLQTFLT